jgi:hypothetical protein
MRRALGAVLAAALLTTSCQDRPYDERPYPFPGPTPGQPGPSSEPPSLVIERLSVGTPPLALEDGTFWYRVKFLIRETSGHSSALIQRIVVTSPDAVNDNDPWCWGDVPIVVPAGGVLDLIDPEHVKKMLGDYCAPATIALPASFQLDVSITFLDESEREGTVEATTTIHR